MLLSACEGDPGLLPWECAHQHCSVDDVVVGAADPVVRRRKHQLQHALLRVIVLLQSFVDVHLREKTSVFRVEALCLHSRGEGGGQ